MKKILYISFIVLTTMLFVQCSEDDNDNIIDPDATCVDGIQNGDETGIDCGGGCESCPDGPVGIDFSGTYVQEDQVGRPAVSRVFVTQGLRDDYNTTIPSEMTAAFQQDMMANLMVLNPDYDTNGGNGLGQNAEAFTTLLSRDVLWVAQTGAATFYDGNTILTGRKLGDDVMDFHLLLIFGGPDFENPLFDGTGENPLLISDGVDANDKPFLPSFPYVASPF
ncbi:MAG: DUF4331 family protein [Flavobacteriaceae bacterium]